MAGSLNHIVSDTGHFHMDSIENLGDAYEALEECFALIYELSGGDMDKIKAACDKHHFPHPKAPLKLS